MFLVMKKKRVKLIALALLVAIIAVSVGCGVGIPAANAKAKKLPIYCVDTVEKTVALSFDAAWGADKTEKIMDLLDGAGFSGTFFLVGFWIDAYPELVKKIHDRGFLIGNHSTTHPHCSKLSREEIKKEIVTTNEKIAAITGVTPTYFRAPFGEYNDTLIGIIEELGMQCVQWDVDTLDWKGIGGAEIEKRVSSKLKSGSIVLCHNNSDHILDALPLMIMTIKNKGFTSVRLDKLIYKDNYIIDNNGMQKPNK